MLGNFFFTNGCFCRLRHFLQGDEVRVGTGASPVQAEPSSAAALIPPLLLKLFLHEHQFAVFDFEIFHVAGKLELIALLGELFLQHFMRTSLSPSPGTLVSASRFTFSWKDCALAAAAAGEAAGASGAGRFNTRTSVRIEIARVAKLIIRCTFTKTPPLLLTAVCYLSLSSMVRADRNRFEMT
jgi:hypothetical protein